MVRFHIYLAHIQMAMKEEGSNEDDQYHLQLYYFLLY